MATRRRLPNMMRLVVVCCLFLGSMPLPARAGVQIAEAFEAGILDYETALLYEVYAVRDPESLPTTYRPSSTAPHQRCGTAALVAAQQAAPVLSASFRAKLARALQRPARSSSLVTASGRFRIHYDLDGRHGVDPADADESGIPDYIEEIAATMERAWNLEVVELGYRAPLEDGGVGGGNEYDVYVSDLSQSRVYGLAFPELSAHTTTPVYFELNNNFTDPVYVRTRGQHRAIDVDAQCAGLQQTDHPGDDIGVERFQRLFGAHREAFEPAADTAVGGQVFQTAKPLQQRISLQESPDVAVDGHPPPADRGTPDTDLPCRNHCPERRQTGADAIDGSIRCRANTGSTAPNRHTK